MGEVYYCDKCEGEIRPHAFNGILQKDIRRKEPDTHHDGPDVYICAGCIEDERKDLRAELEEKDKEIEILKKQFYSFKNNDW